MSFNDRIYLVAAQERVTEAGELYRLRRYALAHYVSGVAVEAIFRAYRHRIDPEFDARHDLWMLSRAARFAEVIPEHRRELYDAALGVLCTQWSNDHRFRSEDALKSFLRQLGLHKRIKGDFVKERTRRIMNAAIEIVNLGAQQWERSRQN